MELKVKGSFYRDLDKFSNRELAIAVRRTLEQMIKAQNITQIPNLKKLKKFNVFYRVKVLENYRIGIVIRNNIIILVGFGHRSNFYKSFP